jgi:hypothetical protein
MNYDSVFAILHMFKEIKGARFAPDKDAVIVSFWDSDKEVIIDCDLLMRNSIDPQRRVRLIEYLIKKETI